MANVDTRPKYHLLPPVEGQGFIVPQKIYATQTAPQNFVAKETICFYDTTTGMAGVPLDKALRHDLGCLQDGATRPPTTFNSNKIGIRILWPGYDVWTIHLNATEGSVAGQHLTKAKLAHEVAKRIRDFHRDMSTVRSTEVDQSWWLNRIPLNQLVLLDIRNVSPGSWQPAILWRV